VGRTPFTYSKTSKSREEQLEKIFIMIPLGLLWGTNIQRRSVIVEGGRSYIEGRVNAPKSARHFSRAKGGGSGTILLFPIG